MRLGWMMAALFLSTTSTAVAETGVGFRAGATLSPDQFHFGGHIDLGLDPTLHVHPNVEIGVGSHVTVVSLGAEAVYVVPTTWGRWRPYVGGGLAIVNYDVEGRGRGRSDSEFGLTAAGGITRSLSEGMRFFVEAKLGLLDVPDLKVAVGWTFAL